MPTDPSPLIFGGPVTVLVAPVGTPMPQTIEEALDPDVWTLISPVCPDTPPEDLK